MDRLSISSRLKRAWNVFINGNTTHIDSGYGSSYRPDRARLTRGNEKSIITSVINRVAMDAAAITIKHVRLDENGRYISTVKSGLNNCLNLEANIDQSGRSFLQDVYMSMMDEGSVALVPIDTETNPNKGSTEIITIRTGKIEEWFPQHIKTSVYNDRSGKREIIKVHKSTVAICENPLFAVMNEPNSTMQRLVRKLNLLDAVDEQSSSGKLDLIIQLPYVIKSDTRKNQAEKRRAQIEDQLANSKYGIAYTDGTEHITQLNRPVENNLMAQIEYLTNMLYSQLGMTMGVLDGTADEKTMLNYYNRTIEPMVSVVVNECKRTFLSKTARTQGQSIMYFRDPFLLVPVSQLAEIADKFTRNEVLTSNEIRQIIGFKPSDDPEADKLKNSNIRSPDAQSSTEVPTNYEEEEIQNE